MKLDFVQQYCQRKSRPPTLLAIKQLGSTFQSLILLNVLFRCVAAETHQDSAVLNTHLQQTDNMISVASGVPLNSAQLHYSLSFLGFSVVCVCGSAYKYVNNSVCQVCVWNL